VDNLNKVRREGSGHFRNKKKEYLKDKLNDLATNCKNKDIRYLYREINEFEMGNQTRNNLKSAIFCYVTPCDSCKN
jgi:hypothetical protein